MRVTLRGLIAGAVAMGMALIEGQLRWSVGVGFEFIERPDEVRSVVAGAPSYSAGVKRLPDQKKAAGLAGCKGKTRDRRLGCAGRSGHASETGIARPLPASCSQTG